MVSEAYSRQLIRTARREAGLSQTELARRAKTSQAAISAYESGRRSPSVETLSRVLSAAGFELRMRMASPDSHETARKVAESLLPPAELSAFNERERQRASRARRDTPRATPRG